MLDAFGERLPPHNDEAEMALLGAILHNNRAFERVSDFLKPEHFASRVHGRIFGAVARLIDRGSIADPITLKGLFEQDGDLTAVGGYTYLMRLAGSVASIVNAEDYGHTVHDLHIRRMLISLGEDVVRTAYVDDLDETGHQQAQRAEAFLADLLQGQAGNRGAATMHDLGEQWHTTIERAAAGKSVAYLTTGIHAFDQAFRLRPGHQGILAARPSMGKTSLALCAAIGAARKGTPVAFFSLEMTADELFCRAISVLTDISADRQNDGPLDNTDLERLIDARAALDELPLFIIDRRGMTAAEIRTEARTLHRTRGVRFMIVDHLGLVRPNRQINNPVVELGETAEALRVTAGDLDIPSLVLCQLNRGPETRDDKRPNLGDLRQSGSIEEHADSVGTLYREEYYLSRSEPTNPELVIRWENRLREVGGLAELMIHKRRGGAIGKHFLHFSAVSTRFTDMVRA